MTDPPSPCSRVSRLRLDGVCEGCLRTLDEIAAWPRATPAERHAILARTRSRRNGTKIG